jgi:hypothetical protein
VPVLSSIAKDNDMHHYFPRGVVYYSNLENITFTLPIAIMILLVWFVIAPGFLIKHQYIFITFFILATISNILHKFTHLRDCELPYIVRLIYKSGILVDHNHHQKHHENPQIKYGVLFPITNVVLDTFGFWRILEQLVSLTIGLVPFHKQPFKEYAERVGYTMHHEEAKLACPSKPHKMTMEQLQEKLGKYHSCPNKH